jgi:hypothetical protein
MVAKPTLPLIPTIVDVRLRRWDGNHDDTIFPGWGISITGNRIR